MSKKLLSSSKEVKIIVKACQKAGWRVIKGSRHIKIYPPEGEMIIMSSTPRNLTDLKNIRCRLQKCGLYI